MNKKEKRRHEEKIPASYMKSDFQQQNQKKADCVTPVI